MIPKCVIYLVIVFVGVHCGVLETIRGRIEKTKENASDIAPDAFISGGTEASPGQFPWMAALVYRNDASVSRIVCGGSLISKRHVLSAAHCIIDDISKHNLTITIHLGEYDLNSYPMDCVQGRCTKNFIMFPDKIMKHPQYNNTTSENDIALLRLRKEAPVGGAIQAIALPPFDIDASDDYDDSDDYSDPFDVTDAGWGRWGATESESVSKILRTTELKLIPKERCLAHSSAVPTGHLCAGDENGRDTCRGDSGGPLMMRYFGKYYLSGVVSYGPNVTCGTSVFGYYTNVFKYMKWIKSNMKD